MRTAAVVLMGRPTSRLIAEGRKPVIGLRFQTKISTREFLTSIEVHADVPRAGLDGWSRKRAFCCPVLWAPEDGDFASGRKDREPATAVREPFAVIVSPVAANVSRGTAPVAEIVSPKGPPFASLSIDDCEPLQLGRLAYNIGDFTRWKEHDAYQKALDRLLRDLRVEKA